LYLIASSDCTLFQNRGKGTKKKAYMQEKLHFSHFEGRVYGKMGEEKAITKSIYYEFL